MSTKSVSRSEELEALWVEFLTKSPTPEQILGVTRLVPELKDRAWGKFMGTNPSKMELMTVFYNEMGSAYITDKAAEALILGYSDDKGLMWEIVSRLPGCADSVAMKLLGSVSFSEADIRMILANKNVAQGTKDQAAKLALFKGLIGQGVLYEIIIHSPSYAKEAAELVCLKPKPSYPELNAVFAHVPSMRNDVWRIVTMGTLNIDVVRYILDNHKEKRLEAGRFLLSQNIPADKLFHYMFAIIKHIPSLREDAWKKLESVNMSIAWLGAVIREAPELAERAKARMVTPPRDAEVILAEMRMNSSCNN